MKKIFSIILIALMLTACAFAETHTYVQTAIVDLEGKPADVEVPADTLSFNDETKACSITLGDAAFEGTYSVLDGETEDTKIVSCVSPEDDMYELEYSVADDTYSYEDGDELVHIFTLQTEE